MSAAPIVFFDIAGPDLASQAGFYETVFGWNVGEGGNLTVPSSAELSGFLRADAPEKLLYIGVPDITATLDAIARNGGEIVAPRFEVPGVVVLGLFNDPAGNRMGLVEMDGATSKVP
jgi:predicted enzyme related to lactoylglutathione lyase